MKITLLLDDRLVNEVRKIALDRDTTLTALVRDHLEHLVRESAASKRKQKKLETLEKSFRQVKFHLGNKTWRREDLHDRS